MVNKVIVMRGISTFLFVFACSIAFTAPAQTQTNLLENANFAAGKKSWKGAGQVKEGAIAVKLDKGGHQEFRQSFDNKELSKAFVVTFKAKTSDDFQPAADDGKLPASERKVVVRVMYPRGGSGSSIDVLKTADWKSYSGVAGFSPAAKKGDLVVYVPRGKGIIYFTDFELKVSP